MPDDITPWTWMLAVRDTIVAMDWWTATGDDRLPEMTHGYPLGWLDQCDCDNGQLLITAGPVFYTGERFPDQDLQGTSLSTQDNWACNITIDYARCRPVVNDRGDIPTAATRFDFAEGLYADGMAIWKALRCAVPDWKTTPGAGAAVVRGWGPINRDIGPCAGFTFELTAKVKVCEPCP